MTFEGVRDVMQAERRYVWFFVIALDRKESCVHGSASTEAEHIRLVIIFARARHRVLQNHISFSSLLH